MVQKSGDAKRRFGRMLAMVGVVATVAIAGALAVLAAEGVVLRLPLVIAISAGVGGSVVLAGILMGLVFASANSGHDDAVIDPTDNRRRHRATRHH